MRLCQMLNNNSHFKLATTYDVGNIINPIIQIRKRCSIRVNTIPKVMQSELLATMCEWVLNT